MTEMAGLGDYAAISCASALERALGGAPGEITLNAKYIEFGSGNQALVTDARGAAVTETLAEPVGIVEILNADKPEPWQWHLAVDAKKTTDNDGNIVTDFIFSEYRILDSDKNPIAIYTHETKKICAITPALSHALFSIDWAVGLFPADSIAVVHHDQNLQLWNDDVVAGVIRLQTLVEKDYLELTNADNAIKADVAKTATDLDQHKKEQSNRNKQLAEDNELLLYASWSQFEYATELNRMAWGSGITHARQYDYSGAEPHHQTTSTGYSPYGGHSHANIKNLVGTAEFGLMANGIYCRTRHNDDGLYMHAQAGDDYYMRQPIAVPNLPADIAAQETPAAQIAQAKKYIQIMAGQLPQDAVAHYADSAQWVMTGVEVFPEIYGHGDSLRDTYPGSRHRINVDTLPELFNQESFYSAGGHKNNRENSMYTAMAVNDYVNGEPVVVLWRYRFVSAPVGSLADYPINDLLRYHEDIANNARWNYGTEQILNGRLARFKVRQRLGENDSFGMFNGPGLLDELIAKIPGLDGYGNELTEEYHYYGANDLLLGYGTGEPLEAGYYNRFYSMSGVDASNRSNAKRGFADDNLWVARTTDPRIKQAQFGERKYGFSYFLPLEIHATSFLNGNFNPYGVPDVTANYGSGESVAMVRGGVGRSQDNPLPGSHDYYGYYKLAGDLFDDQIPSDPADTTVAGGLWVMCADGQARKHFAAGHDYFLQTTELIGKPLRTRYPIYTAADEGTAAAKYLSAARIEIQRLTAAIISHDTRLTKLGG